MRDQIGLVLKRDLDRMELTVFGMLVKDLALRTSGKGRGFDFDSLIEMPHTKSRKRSHTKSITMSLLLDGDWCQSS